MDDAAAVERLECRQDIEHDREGGGERHGAAAQACRERLAFEQLHDDEQLAGVLADLVDATDARVGEIRGQPCFTEEAFADRVVVDELAANHLDRDPPIERGIDGRVDQPHASFTEPGGNAEAADPRNIPGQGGGNRPGHGGIVRERLHAAGAILPRRTGGLHPGMRGTRAGRPTRRDAPAAPARRPQRPGRWVMGYRTRTTLRPETRRPRPETRRTSIACAPRGRSGRSTNST